MRYFVELAFTFDWPAPGTFSFMPLDHFDDIAHDCLDEWICFLKNSGIKDGFKAKGLAEAREKLKEIILIRHRQNSRPFNRKNQTTLAAIYPARNPKNDSETAGTRRRKKNFAIKAGLILTGNLEPERTGRLRTFPGDDFFSGI